MQTLKQAILEMTSRLLPDGFDVSDDAPQTMEQLKALMNTGNRMRVWSGGSEDTIYKEPYVNFAFRAWHDLCHWQGHFPFTLEGEIATCEMQCHQLLDCYGDNEVTQRWCTVLRAEVVGQALYYHRHKRFPENQAAFTRAYVSDPEGALMWPLW
jgi:hypothetical protein